MRMECTSGRRKLHTMRGQWPQVSFFSVWNEDWRTADNQPMGHSRTTTTNITIQVLGDHEMMSIGQRSRLTRGTNEKQPVLWAPAESARRGGRRKASFCSASLVAVHKKTRVPSFRDLPRDASPQKVKLWLASEIQRRGVRQDHGGLSSHENCPFLS